MRVLETLATIDADTDPRGLTNDQHDTLMQWQSWGALADIFDSRSNTYAAERERLTQLLSPAEYDAARRTVLTAFFTDEELTEAMWDALQRAGYRGQGAVLEPGCGKGDFIRTAPAIARTVGVELDPTTARIASLLNPDAQVRAEDFAKTDLPDDTFVATIGNVPFADVAPYDPNRNRDRLSLHNYTISKSIDLTMPGGYVAVITSTGTADAKGSTHGYGPRAALTDRADFITGVRLPSGKDGAFAAHAGTQVATDILVFRVREAGQQPTERTLQFLETAPVHVDGHTFEINKFFAENPSKIIGTLHATTGRYGAQLGVQFQASWLGDSVRAELVGDITRAVEDGYGMTAEIRVPEEFNVPGLVETAQADAHSVIGTVRYEDTAAGRTFYQLQGTVGATEWIEVAPYKKYAEQWARLIDIRDTTTALLDACRDEASDDMHALRTRLNTQYDTYVDHHGPINLHEVRQPKKKNEDQVLNAFKRLEDKWRKDNGIFDRPFEGDLPTDVRDELMDEARRPASSARALRPHMEGALDADPYMVSVTALEHYNPDTRDAAKGPLFTTNPIRSVTVPDSADNLADAVAILDNTDTALTSEHLAELLDGYDVDAVEGELASTGLAFRDPQAPEEWIIQTRYLSGAVRTKLREAEKLAAEDPRFEANRAALQDVQPEPITEGITMNLGATWIPHELYIEFIAETLEMTPQRAAEITLRNVNDSWTLHVPKSWPDKGAADIRWGVAAANANGQYNYESKDSRMRRLSHHGVAHRGNDPVVFSADQALAHALNNAAPKLNYSLEARKVLEVPDPENKTVLNPEATRAAGRKARDLGERFKQWTKEDPQRYARLTDAYNDRFNNIVAPVYDGSTLEFPGMSEKYQPYAYQRNAVARIVNEPGVLLNHVVGAGKTGSMVMGAMELKRLGKANKPALIVPNHLVDQIAREANQWYPGARVLSGASAIGGKGAERRQMFAAQAATNDWDLVVIPESAFKLIGVSPEIESEYLRDRVAQLRSDLETLQESGGEHKKTVKDIEISIKKVEEKLIETLDKVGTDIGVTFDQTGLDYLIVDEAHGYKNLARTSPNAELAHAGADKATDMDMKIQWLRDQKREGAPVVTFATGTPITNSISELWVMQHYLRPDLLEDARVAGVNAWGNNFTESVISLDFSAGGRITEKQRIASYVNVREITRMNSPFMDYVGRDQIPAELPTLAGGVPTVIEFDPGQEVKDLNRDLLWREQQLRTVDSRIDNPLKLINDGKNATLDPRLAHLDHNPAVGRVKTVTDQVLTEWRQNRDNTYTTIFGEESPHPGGLQIIFCDKGVPSSDPNKFTMYDAIRDRLVENGMDKERICFIHEWDTKKLELFDACNNGKVDVIIGNTAKLSTGANIQSRAVALHHVDVPWRPADMEQRDGRIIRQGNQNTDIRIYQYIAAGTADGHAWGTLKYKNDFIQQIYRGSQDANSITVEDNDADVMARNKALATGNPDFQKEVTLSRQLADLESKLTEHEANKKSLDFQLRYNRGELPRVEKKRDRLSALAPAARAWEDAKPEDRTWTFGDRTYTDRKDATQAMVAALAAVSRSRTTEPRLIGEIGGVPIKARYTFEHSGLFITSPAGQHPKSIPDNLIREDQVRTAEEEKNLPQSRAGFLTRMESTVSGVLRSHERAEREIDKMRGEIDRLEKNPETGEFPEREQLDTVRSDLGKVKQRLRAYNNSAAEKMAQNQHLSRLAEKGRSPGYSVELNPTGYMREENIGHHPQSLPIVNVDGTAEEQGDAWIELDGASAMSKTSTQGIDSSLIENFGSGIDTTGRAESRRAESSWDEHCDEKEQGWQLD